MNPKEIYKSYEEKKEQFHRYIDCVKENSPWDIYTIINPTLIKNPYDSCFPKNYFTKNTKKKNKLTLFIKAIFKYYLKNIYLLCGYFISFCLYKICFKKQRKNDISTIIDVFGIVDKTNQNAKFSENYLMELYLLLEKHDIQYTILLRPYGIHKNPFKLKKFFKIINDDKKDFVFEYEFLSFMDFMKLFIYVVLYPFKTLRLFVKEENNDDLIFNISVIEDINSFNFDSFTRYILAKNLSKINSINKIYSWSEFQVIERSFNYGIRKNNKDIKLIGLQLFLNYETYFNTCVDDIDYDILSSPHKVLVNGKYYIQDRKKVEYDLGVSLRYKDIFNFKGIKKEKNILLLGSYIESDTKYMLDSVKDFKNIIFKNHPAVDIKKFGVLSDNITILNENIYKLFENARLVIGTASGTSVEAVASGISVIIIASQDNLTANPLIKYGQGKIWDIAFSKDEINLLYNQLIKYRIENPKEIKDISNWYKENFFVQPTEKNILKTFNL